MKEQFNIDSELIYTSLIDSIDDYIYMGDLRSNVYYISTNMAEDFGFSTQWVEDLVSVWHELIHEQDRSRFMDSIAVMLDGTTDTHNLEYQVKNKNGDYIWVHCKGRLCRDPGTNEPLSFVGVVRNPESIGRIDHITGLFTHEKCLDHISHLSTDSPVKGGFLLLGIDNFSRINTLNDHRFGDHVLRDSAQIMQYLIPSGSYLYRFDGDQFGILDPNATKESLLILYETLKSVLSVRRCIGEQFYDLTMSGGAVCFSQSGLLWDNIEKCASISLKSAKTNGKNQCIFFSDELLDCKLREQQIIQVMSDSIKNNFEGFKLVFQPIVDAKTLQLTGAEALLRFENVQHGSIYPDEFIPLLESTGLIIPIGNWIVYEAVSHCKEWVMKTPDFAMNINVSYLQFQNPAFVDFVKNTLIMCELSPKHVVLEMTESYFSTDHGQLWKSLDELRQFGIRIAIDDFGTGYSSLGRLTQLNVDIIKIDKIFVKSLNNSQYNKEFISSVVRLCHSAGMSVCLEGVETEDELVAIQLLDADTLQGYCFSRPISEIEFTSKFVNAPDCFHQMIHMDEMFDNNMIIGDKNLLVQMMDEIPLCFCLWNEQLDIVDCNKEAVRLFGTDNKKAFLEHYFDLVPRHQPDEELSIGKLKANLLNAFQVGTVTFPFIHCTSSKRELPVQITLVRIKHEISYWVAGYITVQNNVDNSNSTL